LVATLYQRSVGFSPPPPQRIDRIVFEQVIVEVKATRKKHPYFEAQALSYLKCTGLHRALVINFGERRLIDGVQPISL